MVRANQNSPDSPAYSTGSTTAPHDLSTAIGNESLPEAWGPARLDALASRPRICSGRGTGQGDHRGVPATDTGAAGFLALHCAPAACQSLTGSRAISMPLSKAVMISYGLGADAAHTRRIRKKRTHETKPSSSKSHASQSLICCVYMKSLPLGPDLVGVTAFTDCSRSTSISASPR